MQAIWNFISSIVSFESSAQLAFTGGGRTRGLTIVRRPQSRGMRLTVDPRDATVRLTLGVRAPLRPALAWAIGKRAWIEAELARLPQPTPIVPGMTIALGDDLWQLDWRADYPRRVRFAAGTIEAGGPRDQLSPRILRFLRVQALVVLEAETRALAAAETINIGAVGVGDPKGRWGSCSSSGDIRYSWRLILAPVAVRRATVAHEVAHRVHMNHGADFHRLAARLNGGDPAPAREWLRENGTLLHWFGRDG
jgi:predicted metal-dependent hydrolase